MNTKIFLNVWDALENSPEKAQEMTQRSDLMIFLNRYITRNKLTNIQAACLFGVAEERIAGILLGEIDEFNLESLLAMAAAVNWPQEESIK